MGRHKHLQGEVMLLADKIKKLDTMIHTIENAHNHDDLYAQLHHELQHIATSLQDNLTKMQKHFDSTIIANQKEFQDITTEWVHESVARLESDIIKKLHTDSNKFLEELSQNITTQIQKQVEAQMQSIHEQIDLQIIIDSIKNDTDILSTITQGSIQATLSAINYNHITQESIDQITEYLQSKIDLNAIIKAALQTQDFQDTLKLELQEKMAQVVQEAINAQAAQEKLQDTLTQLTQDFTSYIATKKQELEAQGTNSHEEFEAFLSALKLNAQSHATNLSLELTREKEEIKEGFKEAMQEALSIFEDYLREHKAEAIAQIIHAITEQIIENDMHDITQGIVEKGFLHILDLSDILQEAIINRAKEHFIAQISHDELKEAILQDSTMQEIMKAQSYKATKDRLDHATLKEYITDALKKKAQEILKNDELLRAEAEAQAHLVAMRLQSKLATLQEILDSLEVEYELDSKIALLAEKEKQFQQALQEAKDELKDEFKNAVVSDTIQKYIDSTFEQYDKDQDKETDTKIQDVKTLLEARIQDIAQDSLNNTNTIAQLEAMLQTLEALTDQLKARIDILENHNTANPPNVPTQGNNKFLVFS